MSNKLPHGFSFPPPSDKVLAKLFPNGHTMQWLTPPDISILDNNDILWLVQEFDFLHHRIDLLPQNLLDDYDFMTKLALLSPISAVKHASDSIKNNKNFAILAVNQATNASDVYKYLPLPLQRDIEIMAAICSNSPTSFQCLPNDILSKIGSALVGPLNGNSIGQLLNRKLMDTTLHNPISPSQRTHLITSIKLDPKNLSLAPDDTECAIKALSLDRHSSRLLSRRLFSLYLQANGDPIPTLKNLLLLEKASPIKANVNEILSNHNFTRKQSKTPKV